MAAGLAALAGIGSYTAKPLLAQIKAALVQNIDEPGRNPYLSTIGLQCTNASTCVQDFAPVPSGKRLVVTSITGNLYPASPGIVPILNLFKNGQQVGSGIAVPTFIEAGTFSSFNIVGVNAQFNAFFEPGETPLIYVVATSNFGLGGGSLTLSGYLVSLP